MIWLTDIYVNFDFDKISLPPAYSHHHLILFLPYYSPSRGRLWPQFTTIPKVFNNTPPPPLSWLSSPAGECPRSGSASLMTTTPTHQASVMTTTITQPLPPLPRHTQR